MGSSEHSPRPRPRTDAQLLRASGEDPEAFAELYRRHAEAVHSWLHRRHPQAARDLTAETFARAWLHRRRFRDRRDGSALPWLRTIAGNLLLDALQRDRVESQARQRLGLPTDLATDEGYEAVESRLSPTPEIAHELDLLPPHERAALELRVVEELSYEAVAERLEIRPAAARLRVSRALRRLAQTIPQETPR